MRGVRRSAGAALHARRRANAELAGGIPAMRGRRDDRVAVSTT